jgi:serine phosphatase RsbU (regulator of sigma subunit)/CHASE2 domain-containing sensor protein
VSDTAEAAPDSPGHRRIWLVGLLTLALLTPFVGMAQEWNARLQSYWFDTFQRMEPRIPQTTPAVVVEIDDRSLAALGQWPWPRTILAELIRDIEKHQPAAIGVDILMPEADRLSPQQLLQRARQQDPVLAAKLDALPSNDADLASAIGAGPVVLGLVGTPDGTGKTLLAPTFAVTDTQARAGDRDLAPGLPHFGGAIPNIEVLDRAASGHGLISMADPARGVIRRIPLAASVKDAAISSQTTLTPSLSLEMLRVALHAGSLRLHESGSTVRGVSIGNFNVPTEEDGSVRIYYSPRNAMRYVSALDVLEGRVDPLRLQGKLVLVGVTGLALTDYQNTPLGESMPGSEIHAQLLENLFDQTWLMRPAWAPRFELVVFVLLGLLLVWATPRWKPRNAALLATACVILPALAAFALFHSQRQLYDAATSGLGLLILFSVLLVLTLADSTRRRKSLERVVYAQRVEAAYIEGELEAAQRIQTGILPRAEALRDEDRIELAATMLPAREVGGDLYDFFRLDADRLFFLIGDVAGKGLSASMFMAISKSLLKSAALRRPDATISDLMRAANAEVSRDNPEMYFVTVFAAILDLPAGELSYCNAGHDNPYVLDGSQGLARLDQGAGPPLCTVEDFPYASGRHRMQHGEIICLATDGVADAQDPAGDRYGSERLRSLLERLDTGGNSARAVVDAIGGDVRAFVGTALPADDVTVLAVRWLAPGAAV